MIKTRHVNEVLIGAPYPLTEEVLNHFKIDVVVQGKVHEGDHNSDPDNEVAKKHDIYKVGNANTC
jgi:ethanolamine-phosphate cytidylyltransferase